MLLRFVLVYMHQGRFCSGSLL